MKNQNNTLTNYQYVVVDRNNRILHTARTREEARGLKRKNKGSAIFQFVNAGVIR